MLATPRRAVVLEPPKDVNESAAEPVVPVEPALPAEQDNAPPPAGAAEVAAAPEPIQPEPTQPEPVPPVPTPAPEPPPKAAEPTPSQPAPLFRSRRDIPKAVPTPIPAVIPLIRAPDDPGIDEDGPADEFAEQIGPPRAQAGGWRGFLSRWGGN